MCSIRSSCGLDRAVHHRRRRAQPGVMRLPHDVDPLVRRRLAVAVQQLAHAIDQNLRATARNAVEAGRDQSLDHRRRGYLVQPGNVQDLRRRERVQLELGISRLHRAKEILVPLNRQIRIVAALQQELIAADRDRLVDLLEDLLEAEHVAFARSHRAIERAEVAARDADVRVVDVAVDDVGDDAFGMLAQADRVSETAEHMGRRLVDRAGAPRPPRRGRPVITFATIDRPCSEKLQRSPAGCQPHVGSEIEEHLQSRRFLRAQAVLHIIP